MKKKIIITSALTAALMLAGAVGGSLAWFTSESKTDVSVSAGIVKVESTVELVGAYSLGVARTDGTFENGGTYALADAVLTLNKVTPGDSVVLKVVATNASDVNIKWRIKASSSGELASGLQFKVFSDAELTTEATGLGVWSEPTTEQNLGTYYVQIALPEEAGNEYQGKAAQVALKLEAVQGNKETPVDIVIDEEGKSVVINTTDGWQTFAANVDGGNKYAGYNVSLGYDLDFSGIAFEDAGYNRSTVSLREGAEVRESAAFEGSFNGNNHTISNITKTYDVDHGEIAGVFPYLAGNDTAEFKNVNLKNIKFLNAYKAGGFVGNGGTRAYKMENVNVENVEIEAVRQSGGIIGASYGTSLNNLSAKNVKITAQPYTYYNKTDDGDKIGGIIGFNQNDSGLDITNCTVENVEIVGYKDIGPIAGYFGTNRATYVQVFKGNVVKGTIKLTADQKTHHYENATARVDGADPTNTDFYGASDLHIKGVGRVGGKSTHEESEYVDADVSAATYTVNLLR